MISNQETSFALCGKSKQDVLHDDENVHKKAGRVR